MKEANRPLPKFSPDDVVDFMVTEAALAKTAEAREEAIEAKKKEDEREAFRKGHKQLAQRQG